MSSAAIHLFMHADGRKGTNIFDESPRHLLNVGNDNARIVRNSDLRILSLEGLVQLEFDSATCISSVFSPTGDGKNLHLSSAGKRWWKKKDNSLNFVLYREHVSCLAPK